ncbi:MAG: ABC transporter permease, partial [Roseomonas sp.]|nr:ABC transporter permease [Roseomonas sp.]
MDHAHRPGRWTVAAAWMVAIYLVLPISIVIPVSLTDQRFLSLPQDGLSLRHYATVLGSAAWLGSIWQSFLIAVAATVIAVVAGTLCAIGCWRLSRR